jgi:hypothetical protein
MIFAWSGELSLLFMHPVDAGLFLVMCDTHCLGISGTLTLLVGRTSEPYIEDREHSCQYMASPQNDPLELLLQKREHAHVCSYCEIIFLVMCDTHCLGISGTLTLLVGRTLLRFSVKFNFDWEASGKWLSYIFFRSPSTIEYHYFRWQ